MSKTQHTFSLKLFTHFMKENRDTKSSYSLKKKFKSNKSAFHFFAQSLTSENQTSELAKSETHNNLAVQPNLNDQSFNDTEVHNNSIIGVDQNCTSFNESAKISHCVQASNLDLKVDDNSCPRISFFDSSLKQSDINVVVDNIIESLNTSEFKNNETCTIYSDSQCFENCFQTNEVPLTASVDTSTLPCQSFDTRSVNNDPSTIFSCLIRESIFSNEDDDILEDFCLFKDETESQKPKIEQVQPASFHATKKIRIDPVDIYEFVPEDDEIEPAKKKKVTFDIQPKKRAKKKLKIPEANYRKINLKKKVFHSRGFKKFNSRRLKWNAWKKLQKEKANTCFKCGQEGHWAGNCVPDVDFDENIGEDEKPKSSLLEDNLTKIRPTVLPIISGENADYTHLMREGLEEFGYHDFKGHQKQAIELILKGQSTMLISSTGSGKSLCYQLPAYLFGKYKKYITLVISPLISLMEDQLTTMPKKLKGVCLHSNMKDKEKEFNISLLQNGHAQVLFLSPESIVNGSSLYDLVQLPTIAFACIDEAHCLSEWSNNFRPSYLQLCKILESKLKVKTFLALTATATQKICRQVCRNLKIGSSNVIGNTQIPDNLVLTVSHDINKEYALIDLLQSPRFVNLDSIIIYCTRRETTERLATLIRISMQGIKSTNHKPSSNGLTWDAQPYHAGLTSEQRLKIQKRFIKNDLRVIVATIAFGMGINKSNVRAVIHYNMPKSFESYVQEIGRAGRDSLRADCHLFLDSDGSDLFELQRHIYANSTDRNHLRKCLQRLFKKCKCLSSSDETEHEDGTNKCICPGHELALPINELTIELDMKVENILTLITFIELNFPESKLNLLTSVESTCKIHCYASGSAQMTQLSSKCPPVALALALYRKQKDEVPSSLEFNYVEIASMLGRESSQVRRQLKNLEWYVDSHGKWRKSGVKVQFSNLSIRVKSPGNLTDSQLDSIHLFTHKYIQSSEWIEINKLKYIYSTFRKLSQAKCTAKVSLTKSNQLKETLNSYFNIQNLDKELDLENWLTSESELDLNSLNQSENEKAKILSVCNIEQARKDVRDLISIYRQDHDLTARGVARILQGISSPRFPAEVWGKVKRFWRSNINIDFNELVKFANEELLRLKSLA